MPHNVFNYIRHLRNTDKRAYALAFYNWMTRDAAHEEQDPPSRCNLTPMAALAVRMTLRQMKFESEAAS